MRITKGSIIVTALFGIAVFYAESHAQSACLTERPQVSNYGTPMAVAEPRTFCAPSGGTALMNFDGEIVCAPGQCATNSSGEYRCSFQPGGGCADV